MTARLQEGLKSILGTRLAGTPEANILFCRLPSRSSRDFWTRVTAFTTAVGSQVSSVSSPPLPPRRTVSTSWYARSADSPRPRSRKAGVNGFERRDQPAAADLVEGDPQTGSGIGGRIIADRDGLVDEHQYHRGSSCASLSLADFATAPGIGVRGQVSICCPATFRIICLKVAGVKSGVNAIPIGIDSGRKHTYIHMHGSYQAQSIPRGPPRDFDGDSAVPLT
jgi:hypothetical protein